VLRSIDTAGGHIFNLGGGADNSISLLELIDLITELTGHAVSYGFADWRPGDQPWYVSDTAALSSAVGWRPRTPLAAGLIALKHWLQNCMRHQVGTREVFA
jgi:CDP-paratose 2-epimerase